ncbi:MAG: CotH kinase family protein, partial [Bacteroidales bacterium]
SSAVVYTIVAENGSSKEYTVTVTRRLSTDKQITSFVFDKAKNPRLTQSISGVINQTARTIVVELPGGTSLSGLIATYVTSGVRVAANGIQQTNGVTANNFTNPLIYSVTAEDGSTFSYTVTVTAVSSASFVSFSIERANNPALPASIPFTIDEANHTITGSMLYWINSAQPDRLIANFAINGASVRVSGTLQTSGSTQNSFKNPLTYTVRSSTGSEQAYTVRLICPQVNATLPVLRFDVPGTIVKDPYTTGKLEIYGNGITEGLWDHSMEDIEIRLRGNSTAGLPKKPYRLKFPQDYSPLGLNHTKANSWVLLANDADKTLLRNAVAFEISKTLFTNPGAKFDGNSIPFTPANLMVDLYLNGRYDGVYHFTDQIEKEKGRVAVEGLHAVDGSDPALITGGYLLELDGFASGEPVWFTTPQGMKVTIKYPENDDYAPAQKSYITTHVSTAENVLFSSTYTHPTTGWRKYFDEGSLIDYYIVSEFTGNPDAWWSTFIYKRRDNEKIYFGPVWDFDIAFDNDNRITAATTRLMLTAAHEPRTWFVRFLSDATLKSAVKSRWNSMKAQMKANALNYIDTETQHFYWSRVANFIRWDITDQRLGHAKAAPANYDAGTTQLRNYINARYTFLDNQFNAW